MANITKKGHSRRPHFPHRKFITSMIAIQIKARILTMMSGWGHFQPEGIVALHLVTAAKMITLHSFDQLVIWVVLHELAQVVSGNISQSPEHFLIGNPTYSIWHGKY